MLLAGQKLNAYMLNAKVADVGLSRFAADGYLSHVSKVRPVLRSQHGVALAESRHVQAAQEGHRSSIHCQALPTCSTDCMAGQVPLHGSRQVRQVSATTLIPPNLA